LDYQAQELRRAGVRIELNREVTPQYAKSMEADIIIAALGAVAVVPNIDGIDGCNVLSASDAYKSAENIGGKVVILGAGLVGMELSIHLAMLGREITVIEMLDSINDGGNFQHMKAVRIEMERHNVKLRLSTAATRIDADGVHAMSPNGELFFKADNVVYAVGQAPLSNEAAALRDAAPEFYEIGDCVRPRNIMSATAAAYEIAKYAGR
jgi:pyruvate/2-oxoglutarate dehydrogenase complex dihydrolipoamide dehydrogenase (E3) component